MKLLTALLLALLGCTAACEHPEQPFDAEDFEPATEDTATVTIGLQPQPWD